MSVRSTVVIALALVSPVLGGVYSYECDSFPSDAGWETISEWCGASQWVEDGQLFQDVDFCPGYDPPQGQQFDYSHTQAPYLGHSAFFMEWVVQTDGDRSEISYVAPVSVSASNGGSYSFQTIIASDYVKFARDFDVSIIFTDITLGVPHTYRIELYGDQLYRWYIDHDLIDSGVPEGNYLTSNPRLLFRAKAKFVESTAVWDYIRWGISPPMRPATSTPTAKSTRTISTSLRIIFPALTHPHYPERNGQTSIPTATSTATTGRRSRSPGPAPAIHLH